MNKQIEEFEITKNAIRKSENADKVYMLNNELELLIQSLDYQKVDKNSVVLTKEELNQIINQTKETEKNYYKRVVIPQSSKETAREILHKVLSYVGSNQKFWLVDNESITIINADYLFGFLYELAKQYGVEIKD